MFWNRKGTKEGEEKLPGAKSMPNLVGMGMVTQEKKDPDWVWQLKVVVRPAGKKKAFYCRVFSAVEVEQAGVKVKNWTSLDERPDLILWEGHFDEETNKVRAEKYLNTTHPPN